MTITTDEVDTAPALGDVPLVHWPRDEARRADLAAAGRPRLLVLARHEAPPLVWDELEDWVRADADLDELQARAATLMRRTGRPSPAWPILDADGVLREGRHWVAIPPIEARLLAALLHRPGQVVDRAELLAAGWPRGAPSARVLDRRVMLLRSRIEPLGIAVRTIRGRGFLLDRPVLHGARS
jgi:hypothetical protein